jgi:hypothetical protein
VRLQIEYTLIAPGWVIGEGHESLRYDIDGRVYDLRPAGPDGKWNLLVEGPVNPKGISLATENLPVLQDGTPARMLDVPESATLLSFAQDVTNALSFLYSGQMTLYARLKRRLVVENDDDRRLLDKMGTNEPHNTIRLGSVSMVQVADTPPPLSVIEALLSRSVGLRLYIGEQPELAYVRLWRVLESAFGVQGRELTARIASFQPAVALGFDELELERLRELRGRAAHAATRKPRVEVNAIRQSALESMAKLRSLVHTILLTKKTWGKPTCGVQTVEIPSAYGLGKRRQKQATP